MLQGCVADQHPAFCDRQTFAPDSQTATQMVAVRVDDAGCFRVQGQETAFGLAGLETETGIRVETQDEVPAYPS
tara:strand:- start:1046 stop:1267 length:222 start_codon:yes stop_codon:yes gene_type:complete